MEFSKRPIIGNPPEPQAPGADQLEAMIAGYARYGAYAEGRKARLADLMARHSAKRWSPAKKAQMARRYYDAGHGAEQAAEQIAALGARLQQLTAGA